ncbi:MAG: S41 family peptidase [Gemmatimonadaceae bacterium]
MTAETPKHYDRRLSRLLLAGGALAVLSTGCATPPPTRPDPVGHRDEPLAAGLALATFDSLWNMVSNTYVDTAFVSSRWMQVKASLRPRAQAITGRNGLDSLLADALSNIPDSHFYIIPSRVATVDSTVADTDGRGTTGLTVRVAEGRVVAWRVAPRSPAAMAGIRPGQTVRTVSGRNTDSAMKNVTVLPEAARQRALSTMLHGLNGLLNPAVGEAIRVAVGGSESLAAKHTLVGVPATGRISQFGNLPPIAGTVEFNRITTSSGTGCVGVVAFNIWLPALVPDLAVAIDSARTCQGIVVDLRGNPGGVGAMVMGFGGYFVDSTRSLGTMRTRQVSLNFVINPRAQGFSGPVAILVDPMTASTSEIFAAGMQRLGRVRVFGEQSAGAALPALMERLPSGDVFVHAVADFTDPRGGRIEGAGAVPDEIVPLRITDLAAGKDAALDAAVRWIIKGAPFVSRVP